jgi:thiol-disulfide isomerase/thioredoxin
VLTWQNGETLEGEWVAASASDLTWKTTLFEDPLVLGWPALRRIERTVPAATSPDPFRFIMRDGSHLLGDLLALDETTITMRSARHGDVTLKCSEVLSAQRLKGGRLLAAGPIGGIGWKILNEEKKSPARAMFEGFFPSGPAVPSPTFPSFKTGPGGALSLPYWNRAVSLEVAYPEVVDVEFRLRSSSRPDFQFFLGGPGRPGVCVETWDHELVLVAANEFKLIRKIADEERDVALRLCVDGKARKCSVFTAAGERLIDWTLPDEAGIAAGDLALRNKGRDLSLEFLRVRAWDGQPPPKISGKGPRVELADGRILEGQIGEGPGGSLTLRRSGQDAALPLSLKEVDAIVFDADVPKVPEGDMSLSFADGTLLAGRIESLTQGRIDLRVSFVEALLSSVGEGLRQCFIRVPVGEGAVPEPPLPEWDQLTVNQKTLHGRLAATGDAQPRWLPVGGVQAARLSKSAAIEIARAFPPEADLPGAPALFYTTGGEILPGNLRSLDRSGAEIDSSFFEIDKFPADHLEAILFGALAQRGWKGFGDAGWRVLKGNEKTVGRKDDSMTLQPGTSVGHASVLQSNDLQFSLGGGGYAAIRLRLFCAATDATKSTNLIIANFGDSVYWGMETSEGQMDQQQQSKVVSGEPVIVRLVIREKQVDLHLNGVAMRTFAIDPTKRAGVGLIIEPASMWGNEIRAITLSAFAATVAPGRTWVPEVTFDTRRQVLTVPRFRKDDPPRHAIIAGNGDVLRGEIEAATASHFGFRTGLENLRVPRERVRAAVWLKKPEEGAPTAAPVQNPVLKSLERKIERRIRYSSTTLSSLVAALQREAPGLKFKLPSEANVRRMPMQFGGQTVGEALEEICTTFGVRYRVDTDGTIVIEGTPAVPKDLLQKVYWLKTLAFPATGSVQELLTGKGLTFSNEASAQWQPKTRQLTMTNTAANHVKLAELLEADFGGVLALPTHWLLLTSGARFGLVVEKFEPEFVTGQHPSYGRCRVPMTHVHAIRTAMPEPTAAMKSLADWRLFFAPEPVLPETGGESSPVLGKVAATFKLPLLGGGDFDLTQEQGKVVVLDFWATWCGPCIKSLPALIEAMSGFPADRVKFIGVNQSEPADQVKRFLETRGWKMTVALDAGQGVARKYDVDGIPHTVIVGPDGKVAWVKTGYSADGAAEAAKAVQQLLAAPAGR